VVSRFVSHVMDGLLTIRDGHCTHAEPAVHRRCGCVERSTLGQRKQVGEQYVSDDVTIRSAKASCKWGQSGMNL
jgi:hypothetical protein